MIQIAGIVVIGGVEKARFDLRCNVHPDDAIEQEALDVNGITREQIAEYPNPKEVYWALQSMFCKHIDRFNKEDKFFAAGQNVKFDVDFLHNHFLKHGKPHPKQECTGDPFLFSFIHGATFDTMNLAMMYEMRKGYKVFSPNYKLETICKTLGVKLEKAHDALADIEATRKAANIMWAFITGK